MEYHALLTLMRYVTSANGSTMQCTSSRMATVIMNPGHENRQEVYDLMLTKFDPMFGPGSDAVCIAFSVEPLQLPTDDGQDYLDDILAAVDKFERGLGFTAPELFPMRIGELRESICAILGGEGDESGGADLEVYSEGEARSGVKDELNSLLFKAANLPEGLKKAYVLEFLNAHIKTVNG